MVAGVGLFDALGVGVSGMFTSQLATQIVNHNIANANTPGFTRQAIRIGNAFPALTTLGTIGRGSLVLGVTRSRDQFLARQLVEQQAQLSGYEVFDETLASVEQIMGSLDNDRIGNAMNEFFAAWSDLATPPVGDGKRQAVLSQGQRLALQMREVHTALAGLERDARAGIDDEVAEVNVLLRGVAQLNEMIVANKVGEQLPNDLLDQRDFLLENLSQLTRFTTNDRGDGSVDVVIEGRAVVTRGHVNELRVTLEEGLDGQVTKKAVFGGRDPVVVDFQTGRMVGNLKLANETLPELRKQLDGLAVTLMQRVNELHMQGVTDRGSGLAFFTGTGASNIEVNEAFAGNARLVVSGRSGSDGDNSLALEIAALGTAAGEGDTSSLNELYGTIVVGLSSQQGSYRALRESQDAITQSVRNRFESDRGVNLDEELSNLVMFQRSFEANARVIRAVDEMLDTLINGMI